MSVSYYDYKIWKDTGVRVFFDTDNGKNIDEQKIVDSVGLVEDAIDELREMNVTKIEIYNSTNTVCCEVNLKKLFPQDQVKTKVPAINI